MTEAEVGQGRPVQVVVHVWWTEGSASRQETYGPWAAAGDDSHLEQIVSFLKDWKRATGCEPSVVTMAVLVDPGQFPARLRAPGEWTPEQAAEFQERWDALHSR